MGVGDAGWGWNASAELRGEPPHMRVALTIYRTILFVGMFDVLLAPFAFCALGCFALFGFALALLERGDLTLRDLAGAFERGPSCDPGGARTYQS
jgi:hypothetical protein